MPQIENLTKPTWCCVHFVRNEDDVPAIEDLQRSQLSQWVIEGSAITSRTTFFDALAAALQFPEFFGRNWEAFAQALTDLSWLPPAKGYLLVVRDADALWQTQPQLAAALLETWLTAAGEWARQNRPFHLVFVSPGWKAAW